MITLEYPVTTPTLTVTLRNPEFGNIDRIDTNMIERESRHGSSITYKDADWPVIRTKVYNFTTITKTVIDGLKTFLTTSAGLKIKLTDHNGDSFTGIIATAENEIVTTKDTCSYDVGFEFMVTD